MNYALLSNQIFTLLKFGFLKYSICIDKEIKFAISRVKAKKTKIHANFKIKLKIKKQQGNFSDLEFSVEGFHCPQFYCMGSLNG